MSMINEAIALRFGMELELEFLADLGKDDIGAMLPVPVLAENATADDKQQNQVKQRARVCLGRLVRHANAAHTVSAASTAPGAAAPAADATGNIQALCNELRAQAAAPSLPAEGPAPPLPAALAGLSTERQTPGDVLAGLQNQVNQGLGKRKVPFLPAALVGFRPELAKCSTEGEEEVFGGFPAFLHCFLGWAVMVTSLLPKGSDSYDPASGQEPPRYCTWVDIIHHLFNIIEVAGNSEGGTSAAIAYDARFRKKWQKEVGLSGPGFDLGASMGQEVSEDMKKRAAQDATRTPKRKRPDTAEQGSAPETKVAKVAQGGSGGGLPSSRAVGGPGSIRKQCTNWAYQGRCSYGAACRFTHDTPPNTPAKWDGSGPAPLVPWPKGEWAKGEWPGPFNKGKGPAWGPAW